MKEQPTIAKQIAKKARKLVGKFFTN